MTKVWIEKTLVRGRPTREKGDRALGKTIWSPTQGNARAGRQPADVYRNMREVKKDDLVLHLIDNSHITGVSIVKSDEIEQVKGLPNTDWDETRDCYLHRLEKYVELVVPIDRQDIFSDTNRDALTDINDKSEVFYTSNFTLRQGAYLTPCNNELGLLLNSIYKSNPILRAG